MVGDGASPTNVQIGLSEKNQNVGTARPLGRQIQGVATEAPNLFP